jgi:hypothetical protein
MNRHGSENMKRLIYVEFSDLFGVFRQKIKQDEWIYREAIQFFLSDQFVWFTYLGNENRISEKDLG